MRLQHLILAILLISNIGCTKEDSSKIVQDSIYTTYQANYAAENNRFSAEAIFNFGGSTGTYLSLDGESTVTLNGEKLEEDVNFINQVIYKLEKNNLSPEDIWKTHTFYYNNNDSKEFINTFTVPRLVNVQYENTTIDINSKLVASWNSPDEIGDDAIYITIITPDTRSKKTYTAKSDLRNATSGTITIPQEEIAELGPGDYDAKICRNDTPNNIQTPSEGGYLSSSSCSTLTEIIIEDAPDK